MQVKKNVIPINILIIVQKLLSPSDISLPANKIKIIPIITPIMAKCFEIIYYIHRIYNFKQEG